MDRVLTAGRPAFGLGPDCALWAPQDYRDVLKAAAPGGAAVARPGRSG